MTKNIIFVKCIIFLTIIVTNATAYDTCLSPRTKDQDCDCDILKPRTTNQRKSGALIEFAICRNFPYSNYKSNKIPLQILVTAYDPLNIFRTTLGPFGKPLDKWTEGHWNYQLTPQSHETKMFMNWKRWSMGEGKTAYYCPDITIPDREGGDQNNAERKGHWKEVKNGEDGKWYDKWGYEPTNLKCPETEDSGDSVSTTIFTNHDEEPRSYIGINIKKCGNDSPDPLLPWQVPKNETGKWYLFSYIFKGFDVWKSMTETSTYIPSWINCPRIAAPCDANNGNCACAFFGDDEVCKTPTTTNAPVKAPTTDAPRKIEEPQTVGEKIDNDRSYRSSLPWESAFGWIILGVTMVAAAGMFYMWYRNENGDYSSREGTEMGYLPMMEKQ